jgi:hypothetical protein
LWWGCGGTVTALSESGWEEARGKVASYLDLDGVEVSALYSRLEMR